ncbi:MAG: tyrosine-protein phosphatase [Solirubrobacteraceae bacterium]|nr:tyrosine-protein phosphatase [Solirubrobacteraceae bacterium]
MPDHDAQLTAPAPRRRIAIPGTFNLRDVGGLSTAAGPVRSGVLFRSDGLANLDDDGRAAFAALGVRTVVDLRQAREAEQHPSALPDDGPERHHVPVFAVAGELGIDMDRLADIGVLYRALLDRCAEGLTAAVRRLAAPGALPALVHCAAGKDRTGMVVALSLSLAGVPDEQIVEDYSFTARLLSGDVRDRLEREAIEAGLATQLLAVAMDAPAPAMAETLTHLREAHGGAEAYLLRGGASEEELQRLRDALVG